MALRRLRKFARQGNDLELDMDGTIKSSLTSDDSGAVLTSDSILRLFQRPSKTLNGKKSRSTIRK